MNQGFAKAVTKLERGSLEWRAVYAVWLSWRVLKLEKAIAEHEHG
jgi:hypothetical protein